MRQSLTAALMLLAATALAQHDMGHMDMPIHPQGTQQQPKDTSHAHGAKNMNMSDMRMAVMAPGMPMTSALSRHLTMARDGSGTAWQPDAAPMFGYMAYAGNWMFMFSGDIFPRYNRQNFNNRGVKNYEKWDAPDMLMAMAQRTVGAKGLFHFNLMLSTDAWIAGPQGYPLTYQTGESWSGVALVNRQHPHDLFAELSVSYSYSLSRKADVFAYVGYPGEPALGPVTFMHRASGRFMPDAPIGHHWEDATHITFGVATVGVRYGQLRLEGSSFTGREPDDDRYNFEKPLFDSWSGRLSWNPGMEWSMQVSHGFIKSPEALRPDENVNRTTASATYVHAFAREKYIAATALWGQNATTGEKNTNAALLEATLKLKKLAVYSRYEWVQKSLNDFGLGYYAPGDLYHPFTALTVGGSYDVLTIAHRINVAAGAQVSSYWSDSFIDAGFGKNPLSGELFLHLYPGIMK